MADRCRSGREYETGNAFLAKTYYQNRVSFAIFALQIDVRRAVLGYVVTLMMNLSTIGAFEKSRPRREAVHSAISADGLAWDQSIEAGAARWNDFSWYVTHFSLRSLHLDPRSQSPLNDFFFTNVVQSLKW